MVKCIHVLLIIVFYNGLIAQSIEIRTATLDEIPSILELDERVTYEFFSPLYSAMYAHVGVSRDVDQDLKQELDGDAKNFLELVKNQGSERLHIAWDTENNIPCGLLVFSQQEHNEVMLDLLLVDKNYRGKGIGKRLVHSVFQVFEQIKAVNVYPIQFANEGTLKFYEALGFKNCGVASKDKINSHGIRHSDIYYCFRLDVE